MALEAEERKPRVLGTGKVTDAAQIAFRLEMRVRSQDPWVAQGAAMGQQAGVATR